MPGIAQEEEEENNFILKKIERCCPPAMGCHETQHTNQSIRTIAHKIQTNGLQNKDYAKYNRFKTMRTLWYKQVVFDHI